MPAGVNGTWTQVASGIVVRVTGRVNGGANVQVCRKAVPAVETAESCRKKLDNDCNFKVGLDDPACKAFPAARKLLAAEAEAAAAAQEAPV